MSGWELLEGWPVRNPHNEMAESPLKTGQSNITLVFSSYQIED